MQHRMPGRATADGTRAFADAANASRGNYRAFTDLTVSNLGLGTHLGDASATVDAQIATAVTTAVRAGVNVVDTALSYRGMRSERAVGRALRALARAEPDVRERVLVSTKGGWVPADAESGAPDAEDARAFLSAIGLDPDAHTSLGYYALPSAPGPDGLVDRHCLHPAFLEASLDKSRANLGLDTIDLYYVHNPECELLDTPRDVVMARLRAAFRFLESAARDGRIARYGVATWFAFRVAPGDPQHLALEELVRLAEDAAGGHAHHFAAVQLPLNVTAPEAFAARTQRVGGETLTALEAAEKLGLHVFTNASLGQGAPLTEHAGALEKAFPMHPTERTRALEWTRSAPGVTTALAGMKTPANVSANVALMRAPPARADAVRALVPRDVEPDATPGE